MQCTNRILCSRVVQDRKYVIRWTLTCRSPCITWTDNPMIRVIPSGFYAVILTVTFWVGETSVERIKSAWMRRFAIESLISCMFWVAIFLYSWRTGLCYFGSLQLHAIAMVLALANALPKKFCNCHCMDLRNTSRSLQAFLSQLRNLVIWLEFIEITSVLAALRRLVSESFLFNDSGLIIMSLELMIQDATSS